MEAGVGSELLIVHAGRLLAVPGEPPVSKRTVIVREGRVESVLEGLVDAEGIVPGPRIVAAGYAISGTGGHADSHGYRQEILDLHPSPGICNGADLLDLSDEIGTIEPGKAADNVAVEGDPLEDVTVLTDVSFVMARGEVIKQS